MYIIQQLHANQSEKNNRKRKAVKIKTRPPELKV